MPSDNPYLRRLAKKPIGDHGNVSEKRLAKALGARARPASGAVEGAKGDLDLGDVLMEAKSTTSLSMGLKREWLLKIAHEARSEGKTPALSISFVRPDGKPLVDGEWVAVPLSAWRSMTE